ncbi:MAG TPA: sulfite exporter TauE/SafE family protein [Phycisphaerales bacterium]|nr:sulfite exporter TauE/SafE family protein [Phycisphaerales bacterium]
MTVALFLLFGVVVGLVGTLIGVGGGFIMVPVLWAVYPGATPDQITAVSFAAIFANSLSGTITYARMKRVDYRSGAVFAAATIPGSVLGAWLTSRLPERLFEGLLASMMLVGATLLILLGGREGLKKREAKLAAEGHLAQRVPTKGLVIGAGISVVVGLVAAMVGIGGGVIHVPAMVFILAFAVHRATATSHFVLAVTSLVVTVQHLLMGSLDGYWTVAVALAAGAVAGAQIGARLSTRTPPTVIVRSLGVILILVALRLGYSALTREAGPPAPGGATPSSVPGRRS